MGIKRTIQNIATLGAISTSALVANAQTQPKINVYLVPEQTQLMPGQASYLDVIVDNSPLTSDTTLSQGEMTTLGANISIIKPDYITFTGAEFPAIIDDFFYNPKTGQTLDMLQGYNFVGNVIGNRIDSTRLTDFFTHNERDSAGNMIYGILGKEGIYGRYLYTLDENVPVGKDLTFSLDSDHTAFTSGAALEQQYQIFSQNITTVPEPASFLALGLGAAGLLSTRAGRKKSKL